MEESQDLELFEDLPVKSDHNRKIAALDQLFARSARYKSSNEFMDLLKFINRFPWLSPFNAFLIHVQNPGVEIVLPPRKWYKYGRTIKHNARPLMILIPFGPVDFVYDIADTEGEGIPKYLINPFYTKGSLNESVFNKTVINTEKQSIKVSEYTMGKSSAGHAQRIKQELLININSTYHTNEKYSTLIHELAHIFCGHVGLIKNCWWPDRPNLGHAIEEIEAESISHLVCNRVGLQTTSHSYLSKYIRENEALPNISMDIILTVSGYIEQMGRSNFKSKMKKPKQEG